MDWKRIKAEYIAGGTSYRKLAEKYDVPRSNLERIAKKEGWADLRRQAECKAEAKIVNAISQQSAKINGKYYRLVDQLLDKAEEVINKTPVWQPTNLKEMAVTMKYLKECKGVKSDADMREQEARIKKLEMDVAAGQVDDDKPSGIVLMPSIAEKPQPPIEEDENG